MRALEVLLHPLAVALVATTLALLVWFFGRDVAWVRRNARQLSRSSHTSSI